MSKEKVLKALKSPKRPGDIAKETGLEKDVVSKAIAELKKENKIFSPKRCFYQSK